MPDHRPLWEQRFRAPIVGFPTWAPGAPNRILYSSSESGVYQLHVRDLATGDHRRLTDEPVGVIYGELSHDGEWGIWHRDTTGDESGSFVVAPFSGGDAEPLVEGIPEGWNLGLVAGRTRTAAVIGDRDGFGVYISTDDRPAQRIAWSEESIELGGSNVGVGASTRAAALSADESLVCIEHAEHGDLLHPALRILDAETGEAFADLRDEGKALVAFAWSPIPGDRRLVIGHERRGERAPAIWDVATGEVTDIPLPWDRLTEAADWWPDASAILLVETRLGRHHLHRYDVTTGELTELPIGQGSLTGARVRPDGEVWYRLQRGEQPGIVYAVGRTEPVLAAPGTPPPGRPFIPWSFENPNGQTVHGWRVEPDAGSAGGSAPVKPWPTLFLIHGGPTSIDMDRWTPEAQAYVDAGFQVAMLNYRGSIGFGAAWRDELIGNVGWPEVEDVLAGLDDLVAAGLADPARAVIAGWSWGGYITLLMHGMHPERFLVGVAGVPVADYPVSYADSSPQLQAYDRALLGGAPEDVPQLMRERSPIEYVDRVSAPLLILAGENDSRCPIRQVHNYTARLRERNHPHELYIFSTGHSSFEVDERTRQVGVILDFLARTVPGIRRLPGVGSDRDGADGAQLPAGATAAGRMVEAVGIPSTK